MRFIRLAGYVTMGPITGPLAAGAVRNWRAGNRVLAGLYVVAIGTTWFALEQVAVLILKAAA